MDRKVLQTRVLTGLLFGAVVIGCISAGLWPTSALLMLIGAGSTWEYLRIVFPGRVSYRLGATIVFLLLSATVIMWKAGPLVIELLLFLQCFIFLSMLIHLWRPFIIHGKIWFVHVLFYTMFPFLLVLYSLHHLADKTYIVLWILILIWVSDSAAYFTGSWWGKHKLFERISPKKTWEGFLGAGFFTCAAGLILWKITGALSLTPWIILSLLAWVLGTLGDLYESSLKRTFNLKDSGHFLPGHGGFLDRFDSFIYVLPFALLTIFFLFA